jgi:hypothetical protein
MGAFPSFAGILPSQFRDQQAMAGQDGRRQPSEVTNLRAGPGGNEWFECSMNPVVQCIGNVLATPAFLAETCTPSHGTKGRLCRAVPPSPKTCAPAPNRPLNRACFLTQNPKSRIQNAFIFSPPLSLSRSPALSARMSSPKSEFRFPHIHAGISLVRPALQLIMRAIAFLHF